jgi:hypothetical protein
LKHRVRFPRFCSASVGKPSAQEGRTELVIRSLRGVVVLMVLLVAVG